MLASTTLHGERTFYLEGNKVRQQPAEIELARITCRERIFAAELVVRTKLYYWGLNPPSVELGGDLMQYILTARIYHNPASQESLAAMAIQCPWRLPWSMDPHIRRRKWLTEWCEKAIFLALLHEDKSEIRYLLKPVLERISQESDFIETVLREAEEKRRHLAPGGRNLLLRV